MGTMTQSDCVRMCQFADCLLETKTFFATSSQDGNLRRALERREPAMFRQVKYAMNETNLNEETADEIFRLTSLPRYDERFIIPPAHKEEAKELIQNTDELKGSSGFGFKTDPERIL